MAEPKSIAVLPFVNMSSSEENEYFCDGMTEELINAFAKIEGLKVTSRTSSFYFKNKNIPIIQIGQELNVSTILEGSIRLAGNQMRITAQLIDVLEDVHFWSETFDRSMDDLFAVQDKVSLLIADKLREHLGHFDLDEHLIEQPDISVEAYKSYLKGRYLILQMRKNTLEEALQLLKKVVEKYPDYALPYLGIHLAYTMMGTIGYKPAQEAFMAAHPYLEKAIQLAPNLPQCQLNLSWIAFLQEWDIPKTYFHLHKSMELGQLVDSYQSMASTLIAEGKSEAALNYIETAFQLDPFSNINYHLKGFILYTQEKYEEAIFNYQKALELQPNFMASTLYWGQALLLMGKKQKGYEYFQNLPEDGQGDVLKIGGTTLAYASLGQLTKAEEGIQTLQVLVEEESELLERALNFLILIHAQLGHTKQVLECLEMGFQRRLPMLVYLYKEPLLKSIHTNVDFKRLMKQIFGEPSSFEAPKRKYKKTLFTETELDQYKSQLEQLMQEQHPYLDPGLSLRELAEKLSIPANHLSQLLNEGFDKNFSEYVNSYRLEAFKSNAVDPANHHLTILALAFESGFNSKTVFNTFFKKNMGITPSAYWKKVTPP